MDHLSEFEDMDQWTKDLYDLESYIELSVALSNDKFFPYIKQRVFEKFKEAGLNIEIVGASADHTILIKIPGDHKPDELKTIFKEYERDTVSAGEVVYFFFARCKYNGDGTYDPDFFGTRDVVSFYHIAEDVLYFKSKSF